MKVVSLSHIAVIMLTVSSCSWYYGHSINLSIDIDHWGTACSPDSSQIYFVCQAWAWQKGRDLWFIMPIEGQNRRLYNNISLYSIDTAGIRLTRLFDCGDLPNSLSKWETKIVPSHEGVTFSISPKYEGWDKESAKNPGIEAVRERLEGVFFIGPDGEIKRVDAHLPGDDIIRPEKQMKYYTSHLPYSGFGLLLSEFDPRTDRYYLKTLERLENTTNYRRAVIEQVLAAKDEKSIRKVYDKMLKNFNKMEEGTAKMKKDIAIRPNLEQIQALLERK